MKVERALLSVYDKTGIVEFAKGLEELGVEILSTGGTARTLRGAGVEVVDVGDFTGHPEMMDGRVKTLHPTVHGGILARRDVPAHMEALAEHGKGRIDLVAVNLYPFEETIAREDATFEDCIEQIDIGGPTLIRASAKNHRDVLILTRPEHQEPVLEALRKGEVPDDLRRRLALDAFTTTGRYDAAITQWLAGKEPPKASRSEPDAGGLGLKRVGRLRHGDNPWQEADLFLTGDDREPCAVRARAVGPAAPTSLRELGDVDRSLELAKQFLEPAAVAFREGVPVGAALGKSPAEAAARLVESGALARAGGAVALNVALDADGAGALAGAAFPPVSVIAPGFSESAVAELGETDEGAATRVLEVASFDGRSRDADHIDVRRVVGALVLQERDLLLLGDEEPRVLSKRRPEDDENRDLLFAFACAKHGTSRAAVLARDGVLVAAGTGRPDASRSVDLAIREAGERADGTVLAIDGPPTADDVDLLGRAAEAGVKAILAPTGEADGALAAAADEAGISLVVAALSHLR